MKKFVNENDIVYWIECDGYDGCRKPIYSVHNGYYLASYIICKNTKHIVSRNSVTSCVVVHLNDEEMFFDEEKALKELVKKNKGDIQ